MIKQVCLVSAGLLLVVANATASGSYRLTIAKPKTETRSAMDRDKYSLGQQVFNGKAKLTAQSDLEVQKPRLEKCQAGLPKGVAKSKSLPALAGKLSEEQLAALEYFLGERYPAKN